MIKLWNQTMPHRCVEDAFEPYLTPYDCDAAKTAIVVCPGGAYCGRADYEGNDVGAWLNTIGITAFVLEYRVAPSKAPAQPSDAQRAMRLARKLCMERGIERLGIMGFSAGGHLAATLSVHYDEAFYPPQDELDNLSACPDFTVLCYSVIDMGEYRHDWSRRFLLGDVPDEAQIEFYSPQRCVTKTLRPPFSGTQHRMQAFRQSISSKPDISGHCTFVTSTSATSPFRSHCSIFSALVSPRTISKPSE